MHTHTHEVEKSRRELLASATTSRRSGFEGLEAQTCRVSTYQHSIRGLEPPHAAILLLIHEKATLSEQVAYTNSHRSSRVLKMQTGRHWQTGLIAME